MENQIQYENGEWSRDCYEPEEGAAYLQPKLWISVKDRLPTIQDAGQGGYVFTYKRKDRQWGWPTKYGFNKWDRVSGKTHTHWMPLPLPPSNN